MRKQKKGRKFHRKRDQRKALLKSLAEALVSKEKIKTTLARAKELSGFVEKLITRAKKEDLSARRQIAAVLTPKTAKKLVDELAPRYKKRQGGYTRILKLGPRTGDGAHMAIIELVK